MQTSTTVLEATEKDQPLLTTHNGDKAFKFAPHNDHLEFFSKVTPTKGKKFYGESIDQVQLWMNTLLHNPVVAMKLLFWSRDPRPGGAKIRSLFRDILEAAGQDAVAAQFIRVNLDKIPEYGRFDDLKSLIGTPLMDEALEFWGIAIKEGDHLACKWAPRKGKVATALQKAITLTDEERIALYKKVYKERAKAKTPPRTRQQTTRKEYRMLVVWGTNEQGNGVIETYLCGNRGLTIKDWDPKWTPGTAFGRYAQTLESKIPEAMDALKKDGKIKTDTVAPHECIRMLNGGASVEIVNKTFNDLPDLITRPELRILPMVDMSESMNTEVSGSITAEHVAVGLGMYLSSRMDGSFHKRFISFSDVPKIISWKGEEFVDGIKTLDEKTGRERYNTNFSLALDTILDYATALDVSQDRMPNCIMVFSDMQFDQCQRGNHDLSTDMSTIERATSRWTDAGYKVPAFVFWNLAAYEGQPAKETDNVAFVSGFGPSTLNDLFVTMEIVDGNVVIDPFKMLAHAISKYTIRLPETEL